MLDITVLIPLRGGSKGIPLKNIADLAGKPLFYHSVSKLNLITSSICISTDSKRIAEEAIKYFPEIDILIRPDALSRDNTSTELVIDHFFENRNNSHCMLVQATSPFVSIKSYQKAFELYAANFLNVVSAHQSHQFSWSDSGIPLNYDPFHRPRRQDWNGTMIETGGFYLFSRESFYNKGGFCRCPPPVQFVLLSSIESFEIDTPEELSYANLIARSFPELTGII